MPTPEQTCNNCTHFAMIEMQCRRNAPAHLAFPGGAPGDFKIIGFWPATKPTNWCGEFKPQLSVLQ